MSQPDTTAEVSREVFSYLHMMIFMLCFIGAFLMALPQIFSSMRGPNWNGDEWRGALILAVLAVASRL